MSLAKTALPRVLHVNDCAFTGRTLVRAGQAEGQRWEILPAPQFRRAGEPPAMLVRRAPHLASWTARLAVQGYRADVLHIHYGSVGRLARVVRRPYVLHLHGTDIRTQYDEPRWHDVIDRAVAQAGAVFFATPDLAARTHALRPDAVYLPVPVDLPAMPSWAPCQDRPRVLFASRWDASKGEELQLRIAAELLAAVPGDVEVAGLDWGNRAGEAAALGVRLLEPRPREEYLALLASATVVVGQSSGILATSELEALAVGVPVAMAYDESLYPQAPPPVLGRRGEDVVPAVLQALADPLAAAAALDGPGYVRRHHDPAAWLGPLAAIYRRLAG